MLRPRPPLREKPSPPGGGGEGRGHDRLHRKRKLREEVAGILGSGLFTSCGCAVASVSMALETVPKDLRHLRACLLCSLVKVSVGDLVVGTTGEAEWEKEGEMG